MRYSIMGLKYIYICTGSSMGLCIFIYVPYVRRVYLCIDANRIRFEGFATATRDGTSRRDARRRTTRRETRAHVYLPPLDATAEARSTRPRRKRGR
jgi:hypothetical protein